MEHLKELLTEVENLQKEVFDRLRGFEGIPQGAVNTRSMEGQAQAYEIVLDLIKKRLNSTKP